MSLGIRIGDFVPGILKLPLLRLTGKLSVDYHGAYNSWAEAQEDSRGYDADNIFQKVLLANQKIKAGKAVFERDSVLYDRVQYRYEVMAALARIALLRGQLNVVDFGGGFGSVYRQFKILFPTFHNLDWRVVEQAQFVESGNAEFAEPGFGFYDNLPDALSGDIDVLLCSSVLQYLEDPAAVIRAGKGSGVRHALIDMTPVSKQPENKIVIQQVKEPIYDADYPCWIFGKVAFEQEVMAGFDLLLEFEGPELLALKPLNASYQGGLYQLTSPVKPELHA